MKRTNTNNVAEYLSMTFILSYFFVHNIFFVLIGITISLYLININYINNLIRPINKRLIIKKLSTESNQNDKLQKSDSSNLNLKKENSTLTLVEEIEELGFIPSINKDNDSNAA